MSWYTLFNEEFCTLYIDAVHFFPNFHFCLFPVYYYIMLLSDKYLWVQITNEGTLDTTIKEWSLLGKKTTVPNRTLWDRNINNNKRLIYNITIKIIITYSCEIWPIEETTRRMLEAIEIDFWRRAVGRSRVQRVTNKNQGNYVK